MQKHKHVGKLQALLQHSVDRPQPARNTQGLKASLLFHGCLFLHCHSSYSGPFLVNLQVAFTVVKGCGLQISSGKHRV